MSLATKPPWSLYTTIASLECNQMNKWKPFSIRIKYFKWELTTKTTWLTVMMMRWWWWWRWRLCRRRTVTQKMYLHSSTHIPHPGNSKLRKISGWREITWKDVAKSHQRKLFVQWCCCNTNFTTFTLRTRLIYPQPLPRSHSILSQISVHRWQRNKPKWFQLYRLHIYAKCLKWNLILLFNAQLMDRACKRQRANEHPYDWCTFFRVVFRTKFAL